MTTLMVSPGRCTTAGNLRWSVTFSLLAPKPCALAGAVVSIPMPQENSRTIFAERLILTPVD